MIVDEAGVVDKLMEPTRGLIDADQHKLVSDLRDESLDYPKLNLKLGDSINMILGYQKSVEVSKGEFEVSTLVSTSLSLKLIESANGVSLMIS
jgi:hypothetical protein